MMKHIAPLIFLFFIAIPLYAQQLALKTYTRGTGLSSDYILSLRQDNRGFLWIGTDRGISRYDGESFRNFTTEDGLPSNLIYYIFQAKDGAMWFGTYEGGACRFDGKKFQNFTTKDGLPSNSINAIAQDKFGRMYFETSRGTVMKRDNKFFRVFDYNGGTARPMLTLRDGTILVSDSSRLYAITPTDDDRIIKHTIPLDPSLKINFFFMNSTAAVERANGEIVMAAAHKLLFLRRTKSGWGIRFSKGRYSEALGMGEDRAGTLWFGGQFGLANLVGEHVSFWGTKNGVDPPFIQSLLIDREGVIWIGTFGGGLKKLVGPHLSIYTSREGLMSDNVNTIFPDSKNRIWVGTKNLANVIQNDSVFSIQFENRYSNDQIRAFGEKADGSIFLGGFNSLFRIDQPSHRSLIASRITEIRDAFSGVAVIHSPPQSNELWLGTYGEGVVLLAGERTHHITTRDGLVSDIIENISPARNGLWFLSRNNGATFYRKGILKNYSSQNGLPSNMIFCVVEEHDGSLWFGTNKGLLRMRKNDIRLYGSEEGLVGTSVLGIIKDSTHNSTKMWIVSDRALHCFEHDSLKSYASFSILPSQEASINQVVYQAETDKLWIATTNGAVSLGLASARRLDDAPMIHITKAYNDETMMYDELTTISSGNEMKHFVLPYNSNNISFTYAGTSFSREEEVHYKYFLEGADLKWSAPTHERMARYRNLDAGEYTFSVIAINPDGIKSIQAAKIFLTITPPFWREWWFLSLFALTIISTIAGTVRYYSTKKLKKQIYELEKEKAVQNERDRISRDLHDNVGSQLTNIITGIGLAQIYYKTEKINGINPGTHREPYSTECGGELHPTFSSAEAEREGGSKAESLLHSLKDEVREAMIQLRETIRTLKSNEMSYEYWLIELRKVIERQSKYYSGEIVLSEDIDAKEVIILKPLQALNLLRIVQEAITNSVKHSGAEKITIEITHKNGKLSISIKDNGSGMSEEDPDLTYGSGIENMKKRAKELDAEIEFVSEKNIGVHIIVILPVK